MRVVSPSSESGRWMAQGTPAVGDGVLLALAVSGKVQVQFRTGLGAPVMITATGAWARPTMLHALQIVLRLT